MNTENTLDSSEGLATLNSSGNPPETRMESCDDAAQRIQVLMDSERRGRSQRRALVKGLVDGNAPYKTADLKKAARSQACNVNWRVAEFYLNMARMAYYDVASEVPTVALIETDYGSPSQRREWSGILTEEFDVLVRNDTTWDRVLQFSISDMVLYGCGPLVFNDETDWRNEFVPCGNLIVPDFSPSEPQKWEEACIVKSYLPPELYKLIRNEDKAREMGWNIEATQKAIMQAHTKWQEGGKYQSWEYHQQQLKNNSFYYGSLCKTIQAVHYYFQEFPLPGEDNGRITHCILINPEDNQVVQGKNYLFRKIGRFTDWNQIVHPMYYDNDGGGYHHSVTGLGQKMYSAMEYQNRLICNIADKAFLPKVFFKPLSATNNEQLSIVQFNEYGKVPAGFDIVQTPIQGFMEESVAFNREVTSLIASNLAQYRTTLTEKSGNPITAYEAQLRASEQSKLSRNQLNHYYNQMDWLFMEKYQRASNPKLNGFMPGGSEAVQFRNACFQRGVPAQALRKVLYVRATRTVGQGSQFMRQQSLQQLIGVAGMLPEGGKMNLVSDYVASLAGQSMVDRYNPQEETPQSEDQLALATLQIGAAKDGIAPVVGGSQNHYIFGRAFLQAAVESLQSLQQGGNPAQVVQFLETIGPGLIQHITELQKNPAHVEDSKTMMKQAMQLEQATQKLKQQMQRQQQQAQAKQQQMAQQQAQMNSQEQLNRIELQNKLAASNQKTQQAIQQKSQKHEQDQALADAQVASEITRKNTVAAADIELKKKEAAAKPKPAKK